MWNCTNCNANNVDKNDACRNCGASPESENDVILITSADVSNLNLAIAHPSDATATAYRPLSDPPKPAFLPRRFGIGTMMVITACYGLLFSILKICYTPWYLFLFIPLFLTGVGLSQMFLYRGIRPREASITAGIVIGTIFTVAVLIVFLTSYPQDIAKTIAIAFFIYIFFGIWIWGLIGYLSGIVVSSIFLLCERKEQAEQIEEERKKERSNH
jgi:uncharacterized protein with PQ loop repeat